MGQNAKGLFDFNFSVENMIKNNQDLYENLIRKGGKDVN